MADDDSELPGAPMHSGQYYPVDHTVIVVCHSAAPLAARFALYRKHLRNGRRAWRVPCPHCGYKALARYQDQVLEEFWGPYEWEKPSAREAADVFLARAAAFFRAHSPAWGRRIERGTSEDDGPMQGSERGAAVSGLGWPAEPR